MALKSPTSMNGSGSSLIKDSKSELGRRKSGGMYIEPIVINLLEIITRTATSSKGCDQENELAGNILMHDYCYTARGVRTNVSIFPKH